MKLKKAVMLIIILIFIILIGLLIKISNPISNDIKYIYDEKNPGNIEIMPQNISHLFTTYRGTVPQRSIYKSMYNFVENIVEKYYIKLKNSDDEQINSYFIKNKKDIEKELGITSQEEFKELINTIKKLNGSELKLEKYTINSEANFEKSEINSTTSKFVLLVKYEENEIIGFHLNILQKYDEKSTPIIYSGGVKSENLNYEYINDVVASDHEKIGRGY